MRRAKSRAEPMFNNDMIDLVLRYHTGGLCHSASPRHTLTSLLALAAAECSGHDAAIAQKVHLLRVGLTDQNF